LRWCFLAVVCLSVSFVFVCVCGVLCCAVCFGGGCAFACLLVLRLFVRLFIYGFVLFWTCGFVVFGVGLLIVVL